ncbi:IclR family transcriptional regulator [Corynebacterium anserum]|uniref:Helix-turn-helix domain-containing protein n=1 Tax=Corynebacterium anserum TaxID=2684406 RepID=A0A7G7YLT4_9CORY|nr:helix-turn-helix domain-containing protein [Corynebacterium anserum]MBC2681381.1 helix-turn-helix domain-containing protein [Corynebacterium anserum]QNH95454.1 helix-turn-helix domain-containing protein [Corynebacterium anserum]
MSPQHASSDELVVHRFPFPEEANTGRPRHRTVDRIADILEHVARSPQPQGLTDIAKAIGAPVSSTQSLVNGLVAAGYLEETNKAFRMGLAPYLLSTLAGSRPVDQVTHEMLEAIVEETGYIVVLAALVGDNVYYLDYACSDPKFEYLAQNRLQRPPLETSAGWAILSGLGDDQVWGILAASKSSQETINKFQRWYPHMKETGECIAPGVALNGADGVAVAVEKQGTVVASVSVIASPEEIEKDSETIIEVLRRHRKKWNR